jgi:hypothetical protein
MQAGHRASKSANHLWEPTLSCQAEGTCLPSHEGQSRHGLQSRYREGEESPPGSQNPSMHGGLLYATREVLLPTGEPVGKAVRRENSEEARP